jgi:hypothetical protein
MECVFVCIEYLLSAEFWFTTFDFCGLLFFRRVRKFSKNDCQLRHVCPSAWNNCSIATVISWRLLSVIHSLPVLLNFACHWKVCIIAVMHYQLVDRCKHLLKLRTLISLTCPLFSYFFDYVIYPVFSSFILYLTRHLPNFTHPWPSASTSSQTLNQDTRLKPYLLNIFYLKGWV